MDFERKIGELIRYRRIELGISQEDLAEKLYVSTQAVSNWERCISEPNSSLISRLSKVLMIPEEVFFGVKPSSFKLFISSPTFLRVLLLKVIMFVTLSLFCFHNSFALVRSFYGYFQIVVLLLLLLVFFRDELLLFINQEVAVENLLNKKRRFHDGLFLCVFLLILLSIIIFRGV